MTEASIHPQPLQPMHAQLVVHTTAIGSWPMRQEQVAWNTVVPVCRA